MVLDDALPGRALTEVFWPVVGLVVVDVVQQRARLTTVMKLENDPMNFPVLAIEPYREVPTAATRRPSDLTRPDALGLRVWPLTPTKDTAIKIENFLQTLK